MKFGDPTKIPTKLEPLLFLLVGCGNTNVSNLYEVFCWPCPVLVYRHLITVESNHMWLIYAPWESLLYSLSSMNMTFRDLDHIMVHGIKDGINLHVDGINFREKFYF